MKQAAAKTLGVAALGAAIAATGAGAANAAAPALPDSQALDTVTKSLPSENVARTLPALEGATAQGQTALGTALETAQPAVSQVLAKGPTAPVAQLLGGLPVGSIQGLGVNGLPLGA